MNRLCHICLALSFLLLPGCKDNARQRPQANPTAIVTPPQSATGVEPEARVTDITTGRSGGELTLALVGDPRTFNPLAAQDRSSETLTRLLFSSLVRFNWQSEEAEPDLAHKWSVSSDGRTWTWHLRKGLTWSDGRALTAADVVFTWNEIIYNEHFINPLGDTLAIAGKPFQVSQVDDLTVRFVTPEPYAAFVAFVGSVPVMPRHVLGNYIKERRFTEFFDVGTPPFKLVGSGPYRLNNYTPGEHTILGRNESYHRSDVSGARLPYLDQIRFISVPTPDDLPHRFLTNQIAVAEEIRFSDLPTLESAQTADHEILDLGPGAESRLLWFNQNAKAAKVAAHKRSWFRDHRFRRAISLAIDRPAMIDAVFGGKAGTPGAFFIAGSKRWRGETEIQFPHDPTQAGKLLTEMGGKQDAAGLWVDAQGQPIEFTIKIARGSATTVAVAETIRTQLQALGLRVMVEQVEFPALLHTLDTQFDYEAILMGFGGGVPDPQTARDILLSSGPMHFWHPRQDAPATSWEKQIDALFLRQRGELAPATRRQTIGEIQAILASELPYLPLHRRHSLAVTRIKPGNFKPVATAPFPLTWNLEEWFRQ